jgi:UDP:flavonoid glycosyltransferase YjiC (YdhE family)
LAKGQPVYDVATLEAYCKADLALLEEVQPDLVIGDFRLSLSVSARLARVPYAALINAHWSPYTTIRHIPIPEHPATHWFGPRLANPFFQVLQPFLFKLHTGPINRVRMRHGLRPLSGLREVYCDGDYTLYLDAPGFAPTSSLPAHHHYLGPIIWSPSTPLPTWWEEVDLSLPTLYVTLGSSGQTTALPHILSASESLGVNVLLATAGRGSPRHLPKRCYCSDYLPGSEAARRANLVVCNGGSATVYQALAEGRPVLGIASNLDQHLTMQLVSSQGAGLVLRPEGLRTGGVNTAVSRLLREQDFSSAAQRIKVEFQQYDAPARFLEWLESDLA